MGWLALKLNPHHPGPSGPPLPHERRGKSLNHSVVFEDSENLIFSLPFKDGRPSSGRGGWLLVRGENRICFRGHEKMGGKILFPWKGGNFTFPPFLSRGCGGNQKRSVDLPSFHKEGCPRRGRGGLVLNLDVHIVLPGRKSPRSGQGGWSFDDMSGVKLAK